MLLLIKVLFEVLLMIGFSFGLCWAVGYPFGSKLFLGLWLIVRLMIYIKNGN